MKLVSVNDQSIDLKLSVAESKKQDVGRFCLSALQISDSVRCMVAPELENPFGDGCFPIVLCLRKPKGIWQLAGWRFNWECKKGVKYPPRDVYSMKSLFAWDGKQYPKI